MGLESKEGGLNYKTDYFELDWQVEKGSFSIAFREGGKINGAYAAYKLDDKLLSTKDLSFIGWDESQVEDAFGKGVRLRAVYGDGKYGGVLCHQCFYIYPERNYILTGLELSSLFKLSVNYISPLTLGSGLDEPLETRTFNDPRMLFVPFDNDKWIRFRTDELSGRLTSYEATAVFDNDSRRGYVVGAVTHDRWKTGICAYADGERKVREFTVFGGAANSLTRDVACHGPVVGESIHSPLLFIGYFQDVRQGLERYGEANSLIVPPLGWSEGVPFGWNSWACVQGGLNHEVYGKASQVLKDVFEPLGFSNNHTAYVNFDACWQNLSGEEMILAVKTVHERGQKAGIYFSPFAYWGKDIDAYVENSQNRVRYRDILSKDEKGRILPPLDGGLAVDPTHPANLERVEKMMSFAVSMGFDYVKLDFMAHGALECVHYNPSITTGMEAYHFGMRHILSFLDNEKLGRPFFINLSIAPVFPYRYAHSRRISCDAFGLIRDTEYMLNSLTGGFWLNNKLYRYNDPDHTVLYKSVGKRVSDFNEGRARLIASVISGTVLLLSDNYLEPEAVKRSAELLDREVLEVAKKGKTFIPVEMNGGDRASDAFVMEHDDVLYIAVFNFDRDFRVEKEISFARLGLDEHQSYVFYNLVSKRSFSGEKSLKLPLDGAEAVLLSVSLK